MIAMSVDHGKNLPLSRVARAVFVTARELADANGIVDEREQVGEVLELAPRTLRLWYEHLEGRRFDGRSLAKRRGRTELWVLCSDIPGIPRRPRQEIAAVAHYDRLGRRTGNDEFKVDRARLGGVTRAMKEAVARAHAAEAELEKISTKLYNDRQAEAQLGVSADVTALRGDLQHAIACNAGDECARCGKIRERFGTDRARYAKADEIAERLVRLERIERAGDEMLASMRLQGVGAAERRMAARLAFQRALEDK